MLEMLYNMCRLCLERMGQHNLFVDQKLISAVADCARVRLKPDTSLPQTVCKTCLERVRICKTFRKIVAKSDRKLRQLKTTHDLPSKESCKDIKVVQSDEFEEPKQNKKTKCKAVQTSNEESSTRFVESADVSTQTQFFPNIVRGITKSPGNKHKEWTQTDLDESSDQSSMWCYPLRRNIFKENSTKETRENTHISLAESIPGEYCTECIQTITPPLLAADVTCDDVPNGKTISVGDSLLADICHKDNPSKQRKKHKFIQELISQGNPSVNVKDELHCAVRKLGVDLKETRQESCEKSKKQKSPQVNYKTHTPGKLIIKQEYLDEKETNHLQTSALNPECIVTADNVHNIKTDINTSNNELSELDNTQVMQNKSPRWKKVFTHNNSNSLCTDDESEYSIKTRPKRNRINDIGGVFKVKIGVSPRLKEKLARKTVEQESNEDDSVFRMHESTMSATMTNHNEVKLEIEIRKEDHSCFLDMQNTNESCKENSLEGCAERENSYNRIDKNLKFAEEVPQVENVHRENGLVNGVSKKEYSFINETLTPKKRRLQRKVKQEIDYTVESEFSQLSGENSDYEELSKENIKNKTKSRNISLYSLSSFENSKENKLNGDTTTVFVTTLGKLHQDDKNTKKLYNSKELVCKKCKPMQIFSNREEYKIHTYLHARINRFC